tara:strand:+ start:40 stop:351 length:312 start_codon:yes stop_codon:yes gene_type:complete
MGNTEQSISDLVKNTPNDMELGKKVREYYWHTIATMGVNSHQEEELSKEYLEHWTCDICGEHTHEVEYDYLGNGTNHLGCELKQETQTKHFADGFHEGQWEND